MRYKLTQFIYAIGKYIINHANSATLIFTYLAKIMEGFMLANAIYLQIENNNEVSLQNIHFYLEAPLILAILGIKTDEQNNCANKLLELLKKQKGVVKCFKHNYDEVYNIIDVYKNDLNNRTSEKTLEFFDVNNYTETDVERFLISLNEKFKDTGIEIVETPDYPTNDKFIDNSYPGIIDETGLKYYITEKHSNETKERAIDNDIKSIASISLIRKGVKFNRLEQSKSIFITTNYVLVNSTNKFLKKDRFDDISLAVTDIDLTTIILSVISIYLLRTF